MFCPSPVCDTRLSFEGVNDIGTAANATFAQDTVYDRLSTAFEQIITQVHTFGIPIFARTITPFSAPNSTVSAYSDLIRERTRLRVMNEWILRSGRFDYVLDFAAAISDQKQPDQLDPRYNSGDYLHPNPAGYTRGWQRFLIWGCLNVSSGASAHTIDWMYVHFTAVHALGGLTFKATDRENFPWNLGCQRIVRIAALERERHRASPAPVMSSRLVGRDVDDRFSERVNDCIVLPPQ